MIQKARQLKPIFEKTFKMAYRKCYEYNVGPDGELTVNPDEAQVVHRIFGWYIAGDGLGGGDCCRLREAGDSLPYRQAQVEL